VQKVASRVDCWVFVRAVKWADASVDLKEIAWAGYLEKMKAGS